MLNKDWWVLAAHPLQPHQDSEKFWGVDNPRLHLMLVVVPVAPGAVSQPPIPCTLELYQETRRCNER